MIYKDINHINKHRTICRFPFLCCHICCEIFGSQKELTQHQIITHNSYKLNANNNKLKSETYIHKYYQCNYGKCNKRFENYKLFMKHKRNHIKLYKCLFSDICHKSFANKYDRLIHEKIHKCKKDQICYLCLEFVHLSRLKTNSLIHYKFTTFFRLPHHGSTNTIQSQIHQNTKHNKTKHTTNITTMKLITN